MHTDYCSTANENCGDYLKKIMSFSCKCSLFYNVIVFLTYFCSFQRNRMQYIWIIPTATSTLSGRNLKLVNNFTCLGSSVWSTESEVIIRLEKAWTAWFYGNLIYLIKLNGISSKLLLWLYYCMVVRMHQIDAKKTHRQKATLELLENVPSYLERILEATPHDTTT